MSAPKDLVGRLSRRRCPGAFASLGGRPPNTNRNAPPLRRWKATWEALSAALTGGRPAGRSEDSFDPVQAAIVAAQIKRAKPLLPARDREEFDLDWPRLSHPMGHEELEVFFQFVHADSDGFLKMYRLKTAQIREGEEFVSAPEEIATVVSDSRFPGSLEAYEIRTADGEVIRLEMEPTRAKETLTQLESDYQAMVGADPDDIHPGFHCSMCDVADLCRTFPAIDPSMGDSRPTQKTPTAFGLPADALQIPARGHGPLPKESRLESLVLHPRRSRSPVPRDLSGPGSWEQVPPPDGRGAPGG